MAELEAEAGAAATYFLMTRSEFYNLDSPSGEAAIERLRELGHRVGLHAVWPHVDHDDRFDPVLAWHNPDPEYMREPVDGLVNVMEAPWADVYRSDSNQHWRQGCPHEELAAGAFERLQLLTHPEIWVYPGATMRETMLAMLDAERERRLEQLRRTGSTCGIDCSGAVDEAAHRPRLRLRRAGHGGADARAARERRARRADRRHRHVRARDRPPPRRRVPPRARRLRPGLRRRDARGLPAPRASTPSCRSRRSTCSGSPRRRSASRGSPCSSPRRRRSTARTTRPRRYALLDRIGVRGPAWRRVSGGEAVAAAARELGYPGRGRLHEAGVLVRLARVPRPVRVGRPARAAAHQPARGRGGAPARGPARAARRRPDRAPRDGARDRQGADDRRDRGRRAGSRSATRRRARRCAPGWRCTSRRSTTPG